MTPLIPLCDDTGAIVEGYTYDAFGDSIVNTSAGTDSDWLTPDGTTASSSAYDNPYQFTARRLDDEISLYHYRARVYNPEIGRFLQVDPIGYDDGLNMYAYVGNNPGNFVDPFGKNSSNPKRIFGKAREAVGGLFYLGPWDASQIGGPYRREAVMWSESHANRIMSEALLNAALQNPNISQIELDTIRFQQNDIANALRHAYISALLYRNKARNDAEQALLIHEAAFKTDSLDVEADFWNNAIGMRIGLGQGSIIEQILSAYHERLLLSYKGKILEPLFESNKNTKKCD